ncbi:MAG: permease-like cell division protein FtsX [Tenuifilum sp.]|uniref:cell division protein FtsX n=1 Tax=Tenuifilum sp. TaxID=2760880 RepID=UPI001B5D2F37|nr:permease-like cell division protein FtsX [Bacteroidales bacterium]HOK60375.1 permease-like cell division protein FtsX [Tenuifilum sp.]MBP9030471.1 permease-like cell division protein FtsX [Bacteroidales bacterium]HOK85563.1 permease-like cell division protein FtsX [Tenuifilum sp.]HON70470.1 permease-like cell division protein FtsX [Tenuifilum sp.]
MANSVNRATKGRLRSSYISSIISISLVLFTLGLLGVLVISAKKLSAYVKENIGFDIYLNEGVTDADALYLKKQLDASIYIKSTQYFTQQDAAKMMANELGEDFIAYLGYNPLNAYIEARLKADYANNDSIARIEGWLKRFPQVKEVDYQRSLINLVNDNVSRISLVILTFAGLMLFISLVLINNTIRLSVYSKRFIINTMKLVGASWGFIRRPFLLKSILHALYASFIAIALLIGLLYAINKEVADLLAILDPPSIVLVFAAITAIGIVINFLATLMAVNKFLRSSTDDLYY